ncbi:UNVERIFIED_CONTAM: hypothetical protein NCL1_52799 [Trichonephila clavipes]
MDIWIRWQLRPDSSVFSKLFLETQIRYKIFSFRCLKMLRASNSKLLRVKPVQLCRVLFFIKPTTTTGDSKSRPTSSALLVQPM